MVQVELEGGWGMELTSGTWERLEGLSSAPAIAEFWQLPVEKVERFGTWDNMKPYNPPMDICPACGDLKSFKGSLCLSCCNIARDTKRMERNFRLAHFEVRVCQRQFHLDGVHSVGWAVLTATPHDGTIQ